MPLCIGRKACKRAACKQRCKSWFGAQPDIERACKNACGSNYNLTKEDFLCSGNYIEEAIMIAAYGYDPCPGAGTTIEQYLDPLGDREREDTKLQELQPVILGGGLMVLAALVILFMVVRS